MAGEIMMSEKNQPILLPSLKSWGNDEWRKDAECKGLDTSDFFTVDAVQVKKIKKVCSECSVKRQCLQFALTNEISWGIYGGMTSRERRNVVVKR